MGSRVEMPRNAAGGMGQTRLANQTGLAATKRRSFLGRAAVATTKSGGRDVSGFAFWRADVAQTSRLHDSCHIDAQFGHWREYGDLQPGGRAPAASVVGAIAR